jgi:hypothetical protein
MKSVVILSVVGNETIKEMTIPVSNIEECLIAADKAFCEALAFLKGEVQWKVTWASQPLVRDHKLIPLKRALEGRKR